MKINNVSVTYNNKIKANSNITLNIEGGIHCLLGRNGAGKSTLIKTITTRLVPDKGSVVYRGKNIHHYPEHLKKNLGYLPETFGIYPNLSGKEFLLYMAYLKGIDIGSAKKKAREYMGLFNAEHLANQPCGTFSKGQKQRIGLIQALIGEPDLIILDEPISGLDIQEQVTLIETLSRLSQNRIIIISSHVAGFVQAVANKIVVLHDGKLICHWGVDQIIDNSIGKIWEGYIDVDDLNSFQAKLPVINKYLEGIKLCITVISDVKPADGFKEKQPTLSEGYMYLLELHNPPLTKSVSDENK